MDCSPPGSSVYGIFQARILEWIAIPSPVNLSDSGIKPRSPVLQADCLLSEPPGSFHFFFFLVSVLAIYCCCDKGTSQAALVIKNPLANAGDLRDLDSIPGLGRCPAEGNGNQLWYSCLENSTDRGSWQAIVHGAAKSQTQLNDQAHILFLRDYGPFWRRRWHPTPVLLPGKSHGWRSLVGCSPWGR